MKRIKKDKILEQKVNLVIEAYEYLSDGKMKIK
jgi:hypothetical protein